MDTEIERLNSKIVFSHRQSLQMLVIICQMVNKTVLTASKICLDWHANLEKAD